MIKIRAIENETAIQMKNRHWFAHLIAPDLPLNGENLPRLKFLKKERSLLPGYLRYQAITRSKHQNRSRKSLVPLKKGSNAHLPVERNTMNNRPRNQKGRERQRYSMGGVDLQTSSGPSAADSAYPNSGRSRSRRFRSRKKERINRPTAASRSKRRVSGRQRSSSQRSDSTIHDYRPSTAESKLINRTCFDISLAIRDRDEFQRFSPDAISTTTSIFVRFGIESFEELRSTRSDQRSHLLADAKKSYRSKSMKLIREIFASSPPVKKGRNIASVEFNEIHLPNRLGNFKIDLAAIDGTLRPVQEMASAISEEIARGQANTHPFHPYIIPNYHERPWFPRVTARVNAFNNWRNKTKGAKKQAISPQQWLHHHLRFALTAELCELWTPFGGIAAQFNHISALLSLATLESAGFAMRYHDLPVRTLADCARARFPFDYLTALSEVHEDTRRAIMADTARPSFAPPRNENAPRFQPKGKQRAKSTKQKGRNAKGGKGKKRSNQADTTPWTGKGPAPAQEPTAPIPATGK